jgi:hypothetical protein
MDFTLKIKHSARHFHVKIMVYYFSAIAGQEFFPSALFIIPKKCGRQMDGKMF